MGCSQCDPLSVQGRGCIFCRGKSSTANGERSIDLTHSAPTVTGAAEIAASVTTRSPKNGTSRERLEPYAEILTDLSLMLIGDPDRVDVTPLLQIAAMAIELELADRLLLVDLFVPSADGAAC